MTGGGPDTTRASAGAGEHLPGLDGLRALAVAVVVLFHLDRLPGGNLGVDAFFVLSGWLITTRLLAAADRSPQQRIDLRDFWIRRVRRLAPASLAVLVAVAVAWDASGIAVPSLRRDLLWALGWSSNWGTITGGGDYWARFGEPSPVTHFWSLAVEEQLYLCWPLVLYPLVRWGGRRRDALVGATAAALAAGSVAFMVATFDATRISDTYLNTLARSHSLLIGAAAAALTATVGRRAVVGRVARWLAPLAGGAVVVLIARSDEGSTWLFAWGFPAFAVAMAVVVVAVAAGTGRRWLGAGPMRWVGDRSYGIYLWHWPVILYLRGDRAPVDGLALDVVRVAAAVALAAVSYRWLELPIRHGTIRLRHAPVLAGAALAAVAVVTLVPAPAPETQVEVSAVRLPPPVAEVELATAAGGASEWAALAGPAEQARSALLRGRTPERAAAPTARPGPVRVLVVGDSTAVHLARDVIAYAGAHPDEIVAGSAAYAGCGLTVADDGRKHRFTDVDGQPGEIDLSGCIPGWNDILDRVRSGEGIDTVLVSVGSWDGSDLVFPDGAVRSVLDPTGRRLVRASYRTFVRDVEAAGVRVVWVTPPDLHLAWAGTTSPLDDPRRWRALRSIVDDLPVEQIDLPAWLRRNDLDGPEGRPDGVHLNPDANARFVADEVVPVLMDLGPMPPEPAAVMPPGSVSTPG